MRKLVLHQSCSILRGMQDSKVIDKDITYPVMLVTNHMGDLEVTAGEKKWIFFNDNRLQ